MIHELLPSPESIFCKSFDHWTYPIKLQTCPPTTTITHVLLSSHKSLPITHNLSLSQMALLPTLRVLHEGRRGDGCMVTRWYDGHLGHHVGRGAEGAPRVLPMHQVERVVMMSLLKLGLLLLLLHQYHLLGGEVVHGVVLRHRWVQSWRLRGLRRVQHWCLRLWRVRRYLLLLHRVVGSTWSRMGRHSNAVLIWKNIPKHIKHQNLET